MKPFGNACTDDSSEEQIATKNTNDAVAFLIFVLILMVVY